VSTLEVSCLNMMFNRPDLSVSVVLLFPARFGFKTTPSIEQVRRNNRPRLHWSLPLLLHDHMHLALNIARLREEFAEEDGAMEYQQQADIAVHLTLLTSPLKSWNTCSSGSRDLNMFHAS
jgi:hypothetical protein